MPKLEIPETLDTLEGVADQYHSLYVKDGDVYRYKDPKAAIEGMRRAKEERTTIQEELTTLKAKYKDVDPEKYAELVRLEKDFKDMDSTNKGELDRIKSELKNQYEGQIGELKGKLSESDKRYASRILKTDLSAKLRQHGVTEKGAELLLKTLTSDVTVKMGDDNEPEFIVIDPKTKKAKLNKDADPYSLEDLVIEAKNDFPQLFGSNAGSGGGAATGDKNVQIPGDERPSGWNEAQKKAFITQHGHDRYRALVAREANAKAEERAVSRGRKTA